MPKSANQKLKMYYILSYLREESDPEHPVTMRQILACLERNGILAERKSVYSDMELLRTIGFDIEYRPAAPCGYFLGTREFELAELKLLVDAVQASKFITEKQSQALIGKLERFLSRYEAARLQRQVCVHDRIKSANLSTLYLVDDIHQAMHSNRTISFVYYEWNLDKKLVPRHGGERYRVSPWLLVWEDENYYLLAYDSTSGMIKYFRVNKMKEIQVEEEARQGKKEFGELDPGGMSKKTFGMFAGEKKRLTLVFEKHLIGVAIDRFGQDIPVIRTDSDHFQTYIEVNVSRQFYGWLAGVGAGVRIAAPEEEQEKYRKYLENIIKL